MIDYEVKMGVPLPGHGLTGRCGGLAKFLRDMPVGGMVELGLYDKASRSRVSNQASNAGKATGGVYASRRYILADGVKRIGIWRTA